MTLDPAGRLHPIAEGVSGKPVVARYIQDNRTGAVGLGEIITDYNLGGVGNQVVIGLNNTAKTTLVPSGNFSRSVRAAAEEEFLRQFRALPVGTIPTPELIVQIVRGMNLPQPTFGLVNQDLLSKYIPPRIETPRIQPQVVQQPLVQPANIPAPQAAPRVNPQPAQNLPSNGISSNGNVRPYHHSDNLDANGRVIGTLGSQDSVAFNPIKPNYGAVADGVSTGDGGPAARIATTRVAGIMDSSNIPDYIPSSEVRGYLEKGKRQIEQVSREIQDLPRSTKPEYRGHGRTTTLTATKVVDTDDGQYALIWHAGDTRAYSYWDYIDSNGQRRVYVEQLTRDHRRYVDGQEYLASALGGGNLRVDTDAIKIQPGMKKIVLVTDGIHDGLRDEDIALAIYRNSNDPVNGLINAAVKPDDRGVVVINVNQPSVSQADGWSFFRGGGPCGPRLGSINAPTYLAQANVSNVLGVSKGPQVLQADVSCPLTAAAAGTPLQPIGEAADDAVYAARQAIDDGVAALRSVAAEAAQARRVNLPEPTGVIVQLQQNFFQRTWGNITGASNQPVRYAGDGPVVTQIKAGIPEIDYPNQFGAFQNNQSSLNRSLVYTQPDGRVTVIDPSYRSTSPDRNPDTPSIMHRQINGSITTREIPGVPEIDNIFTDASGNIVGYSYRRPPNINVITSNSGLVTLDKLNMDFTSRLDNLENYLRLKKQSAQPVEIFGFGETAFRSEGVVGVEAFTRPGGTTGQRLWYFPTSSSRQTISDSAVLENFIPRPRPGQSMAADARYFGETVWRYFDQSGDVDEALRLAKQDRVASYMLNEQPLTPVARNIPVNNREVSPGFLEDVSAPRGSGFMTFERGGGPDFSTDPKYQVTLANGEKWTVSTVGLELDGRTIVFLRRSDGQVAAGYLSTSDGKFIWFVGIGRSDASDPLVQRKVIKPRSGSKEYADLPIDLNSAVSRLLASNDINIGRKASAGDYEEFARVEGYLDRRGFTYDTNEEGYRAMDNLLGGTVTQVPYSPKFIETVDFGTPTRVVDLGNGTVQVYFEGPKAMVSVVAQLDRTKLPDLYQVGDERIIGGGKVTTTFTARPKGDPNAVFVGAPRVTRISVEKAGADEGWPEAIEAIKSKVSPEVKKLLDLADDPRSYDDKLDEAKQAVEDLNSKIPAAKADNSAVVGGTPGSIADNVIEFGEPCAVKVASGNNKSAYLAKANISNVLGISRGPQVLQASVDCPLTAAAAGTPLQPAAILADDVVNSIKTKADEAGLILGGTPSTTSVPVAPQAAVPQRVPEKVVINQTDVIAITSNPEVPTPYGSLVEDGYTMVRFESEGTTTVLAKPNPFDNEIGDITQDYQNHATTLNRLAGDPRVGEVVAELVDENGKVIGLQIKNVRSSGQSLTDYILEGGKLSREEAQGMMSDVLDLQRKSGAPFGQLSPDNIIVHTVRNTDGTETKSFLYDQYGRFVFFEPSDARYSKAMASEAGSVGDILFDTQDYFKYVYNLFDSKVDLRQLPPSIVNVPEVEGRKITRELASVIPQNPGSTDNFFARENQIIAAFNPSQLSIAVTISDGVVSTVNSLGDAAYRAGSQMARGVQDLSVSTNIDNALKNATRAQADLTSGVRTPEVDEAWRTSVRISSEDTAQRYPGLQLSTFNTGIQSEIDLTDPRQVEYLSKTIASKQKVLNDIKAGNFFTDDPDEFEVLHKDIHRSLVYKDGETNPGGTYRVFAAPIEGNIDSIITKDINSLAQKYGDPIAEFIDDPASQIPAGSSKAVHTLDLPGIPEELKPNTTFNRYTQSYIHNYPNNQPNIEQTFTDAYLVQMQRSMRELNELDPKAPLARQLEKIADYYQYCANARMFPSVNQSFCMAIVNGFLESRGLKGVDQGIFDFAAFTLQPENFRRFFADEVDRFNPAALTRADVALGAGCAVALKSTPLNLAKANNSNVLGISKGPLVLQASIGPVNPNCGLSNLVGQNPTAGRINEALGNPAGAVDDAVNEIRRVVDNVTGSLTEAEVIGRNTDFVEHNLLENSAVGDLTANQGIRIRARFDEDGLLRPVALDEPITVSDVIINAARDNQGKIIVVNIIHDKNLPGQNVANLGDVLKTLRSGESNPVVPTIADLSAPSRVPIVTALPGPESGPNLAARLITTTPESSADKLVKLQGDYADSQTQISQLSARFRTERDELDRAREVYGQDRTSTANEAIRDQTEATADNTRVELINEFSRQDDLKKAIDNASDNPCSLVALKDDVVNLAQVNSYVLGISKGPAVLAAQAGATCPITNAAEKVLNNRFVPSIISGPVLKATGALDRLLGLAKIADSPPVDITSSAAIRNLYGRSINPFDGLETISVEELVKGGIDVDALKAALEAKGIKAGFMFKEGEIDPQKAIFYTYPPIYEGPGLQDIGERIKDSARVKYPELVDPPFILDVDAAEQALKAANFSDPQVKELWRTSVRFPDQRSAHDFSNLQRSHWAYGYQPEVDPNAKEFLERTIAARKQLQQQYDEGTLFTDDTTDFARILDEIHTTMFYKADSDFYTGASRPTIRSERIFSQNWENRIDEADVGKIARRLGDKFANDLIEARRLGGTRGYVQLEGISDDIARPIYDITYHIDYDPDIGLRTFRYEIEHIFPDPEYYPEYLKEIQAALKRYKALVDSKAPINQQVDELTTVYLYGINMFRYDAVNHSYWMSTFNQLLENESGLKGIPQTGYDFLAYSLSDPNKFRNYMKSQVFENNPGWNGNGAPLPDQQILLRGEAISF